MRSICIAAAFAAIVLVLSVSGLHAQGLMVMDKNRFFFGFETMQFGLLWVDGQFKKASGTIRPDKADPTASFVEVTVYTASIDTGTMIRDNLLRSTAFFDVKNHPTMVFRSTSGLVTARKVGTVTGNLTIKGITKPVTLSVRVRPATNHTSRRSAPRVTRFDASGEVRREDFGLGLGKVKLTLRANFIACVGSAATDPACRPAR